MAIPVTGSTTPLPNSGLVASASKPAPAVSAKAVSPDASNTSFVEVSVVVTLSVQAQAALSSSSPAATSPYARYFPTRDGKPANALTNAVSNPGAVSSSAGKNSDEVAQDARARMDATYATMQKEGKPFDFNSFEGKDWNSLMGDLDRRSLSAVRSNAGGLFTEEEQNIAESIMSQQLSLATGLYSGPISQTGSFSDPFRGNEPARMKATASFLDAVSNDEKMSIPWAVGRASVQSAYDGDPQTFGASPKPANDHNPLVKLLTSAMNTMRDDPTRGYGGGGPLKTADDLKKQPWFKGFEDLLEPAMQATRALYATDHTATA